MWARKEPWSGGLLVVDQGASISPRWPTLAFSVRQGQGGCGPCRQVRGTLKIVLGQQRDMWDEGPHTGVTGRCCVTPSCVPTPLGTGRGPLNPAWPGSPAAWGAVGTAVCHWKETQIRERKQKTPGCKLCSSARSQLVSVSHPLLGGGGWGGPV